MDTLNCCSGGLLGDFIHQLDVARWLAYEHGPVNLYLSEAHGGDIFKYGAKKSYNDMYDLVKAQPYIKNFYLFGEGMHVENYINLNNWRQPVATTHAETGRYDTCWSELMPKVFGYEVNKRNHSSYPQYPSREYAWLIGETYDFNTKGKIVIHRSKHRHNGSFPWQLLILSCVSQDKELVFVTTDPSEWEAFPYKEDVKPYFVNTITDMANAIWSAEGFVGNQSAPFAIANAMDKVRIVELDHDPAPFYMGEEKYSKNIKWYLSELQNTL